MIDNRKRLSQNQAMLLMDLSRKSLFALFLLAGLSISAIATAQLGNERDNEIKELLCQQWKYMKMVSGKTILPVPLKLDNTTITFKKDSSYVQVSKGIETKGNWSLDHLILTLTSADKKDIEKHRITNISGTELILRSNMGNTPMSLVLERVE